MWRLFSPIWNKPVESTIAVPFCAVTVEQPDKTKNISFTFCAKKPQNSINRMAGRYHSQSLVVGHSAGCKPAATVAWNETPAGTRFHRTPCQTATSRHSQRGWGKGCWRYVVVLSSNSFTPWIPPLPPPPPPFPTVFANIETRRSNSMNISFEMFKDSSIEKQQVLKWLKKVEIELQERPGLQKQYKPFTRRQLKKMVDEYVMLLLLVRCVQFLPLNCFWCLGKWWDWGCICVEWRKEKRTTHLLVRCGKEPSKTGNWSAVVFGGTKTVVET